MVQLDDNGLVIAGSRFSFGAGGADVYLVKINGQGDVLWEKTFGGPENDSAATLLHTAEDGGFVLLGSYGVPGTSTSDIYLIKTDKDGNAQ